jgi:MarR family transcriptional regulator, 2-MHQ and catechol-resistance regulon repressor
VPEPPDKAFQAWRQIVAAKAAIGRVVGRAFTDLDLTGAQFGVLRIVGEAGPGGIKLSDIGEQLFVTCGNVTGLVDRLEERGLLARVPHADDRRVLLAQLTPAGQEIFETIVPRHRARISRIMSCLSLEEQEALADMMERLSRDVEERAGEL